MVQWAMAPAKLSTNRHCTNVDTPTEFRQNTPPLGPQSANKTKLAFVLEPEPAWWIAAARGAATPAHVPFIRVQFELEPDTWAMSIERPPCAFMQLKTATRSIVPVTTT